MKNRLLTAKTFLLLAAFSFFSCKKSSTDDHNYYVKLKINSSWVTWTVAVRGLEPNLADASKTDFGVTANDDAMKDVFDISIQVDGTTFNPGNYASDNGNHFMFISYSKAPGTANGKIFYPGDASTGPSSLYTVNISSITSKLLRGTFTGNYPYHFDDDESMIITEGEFFVGRLR